MYVDEKRVLYKKLGQIRSTSQVYNLNTVKYIAVMFINGKGLPAQIEDVPDDIQMGGNMTIRCKDSQIVMAYRSSEMIDRPTVQEILKKRGKGDSSICCHL